MTGLRIGSRQLKLNNFTLTENCEVEKRDLKRFAYTYN